MQCVGWSALGVVLLLGGVRRSEAQAITLRIRPHLGDTLRMKMEQRVEICGDSADKDVPMIKASMQVYTRAVVEKATATGTELVSITDSVRVAPMAATVVPLFAQTKRALEGKTVHLKVALDGGISIEGSPTDAKLAAVQLPALLPDGPVTPGTEWTRDLVVPVSATHASTGVVHVTLRLDSIAPDGVVAYLSMHGTFSHTHPQQTEGGPRDATTGTISGTIEIDRRLEWMTDSHILVSLLSTVRQPGEAEPTRVHMKVTQSMRAMPRM